MRLFLSMVIVAMFAIVTTSAEAQTDTVCEKAFSVRAAVIKKHGKRAPGRNICRFGVKHSNDVVTNATYDQKKRYLSQLRLLVKPLAEAVPPAQDPAGTMTAQVSAGLPACTWKPESGGDYNAHNPSGAHGKYQIMPEWYAPGRLCSGLSYSPADQERCAHLIYTQGGGAGNWVNC